MGFNRMGVAGGGKKEMKIALLSGGGEKHYQLGLTKGLAEAGIEVELVGNNAMACSNIVKERNVLFYNLREDQNPDSPLSKKIVRILKYYFRLIIFAYHSTAPIFHIQWDNKFKLFDRIVLTVYYKILGKKIVLTVHNVNGEARDRRNSWINECSLNIQYALCNRLIVHTQKMKRELISQFHLSEKKIFVIPHGVNTLALSASINRIGARQRLNISLSKKVILFFGRISAYKGVDLLIDSFIDAGKNDKDLFLIIAGNVKKDNAFFESIKDKIRTSGTQENILTCFDFIPDNDVEIYFKAADCIVLPYRDIYQSGVLFLALGFGLPIIATDVGNLREEVESGKCGFIVAPNNRRELAVMLSLYFQSDLFKNKESESKRIQAYATQKYSWSSIGLKTKSIYLSLLAKRDIPS